MTLNTVQSRQSKFKEVFRSVSTSLKRGGMSLSRRIRNGELLDSDDVNVEPQSRVDADELTEKYAHIPRDCHATSDAHIRRRSWLYILQALAALLATAGSAAAFAFAITNKRWDPAIENYLAFWNYGYKVIEILFAGVYVTFLGQVFTRRAFSRDSKAFNIAEITMRNWVNQPGAMITHCQGLPFAGISLLGVLTILSTIGTLAYTSSCYNLITPRLRPSKWNQNGLLYPRVRTSYANVPYIEAACAMVGNATGANCLDFKYNGDAYRAFLTYTKDWQIWNEADPSIRTSRPGSTVIMMDNTTLNSSWLSHYPMVSEDNGRVINNVTLAMPHAGLTSLYLDLWNSSTEIVKPAQLTELGGYMISASVVSPAINVMCVNADESEVNYYVDPTLPTHRRDGLSIGPLDDVFQMGPKYEKTFTPKFKMLTPPRNFVVNWTPDHEFYDSMYIMAKYNETSDYTICQLRSLLSPSCFTAFVVNTYHANMSAWCDSASEDDKGTPYGKVYGDHGDGVLAPLWGNLSKSWSNTLNLNGGASNADTSNAKVLSSMILFEPKLSDTLPSMAEALAVLASPTIVDSSLGSSFLHTSSDTSPPAAGYEEIHVEYQYMGFFSGNAKGHRGGIAIFNFIVLAGVFLISTFCLLHHLNRQGMVTDYTEPQNLFALAINSPPSRALKGACGDGPSTRDLGIAFRVCYSEASNHYFFEDAADARQRTMAKRLSRYSTRTENSQTNLLGGAYSQSYNMLSSKSPFL
ncbi:hypothetical protein F5Y15DRAFT_413658 [Xylariaceae sp. FL0016]|nr:hypothetical protein F5Y15DRAFT_413658 [Xylariaceae sp. FL0016]